MTTIKLGFMEDSATWCNAWTCALEIGASREDAEIAATLAQWAYRDMSHIQDIVKD